ERMRCVHLTALPINLGPGIREVEVYALYRYRDSRHGENFSWAIFCFHLREHVWLKHDVPGVVELTSLQHGAGRSSSIATTLEIHAIEEWLVRLAVVLVHHVDGFIVWNEAFNHVWTRTNRVR